MQTTPPADDYLTDAQLCTLLHVAPRTTARWRADGNGPAFIRKGKYRVLYHRPTVEAWLASRTFRHHADEAARSAA